jgi:hypothetical protein
MPAALLTLDPFFLIGGALQLVVSLSMGLVIGVCSIALGNGRAGRGQRSDVEGK